MSAPTDEAKAREILPDPKHIELLDHGVVEILREKRALLTAALAATRAEGFAQAREMAAKISEAQRHHSAKAEYPYDGGAGSMGYERACYDCEVAIYAMVQP